VSQRPSPPTPLGAYGLTIRGIVSRALLSSPGKEWPAVTVEQGRLDGEPHPTSVTSDAAALPLVGGGRLLLDRHGRRATFLTPSALGDDELAHPYLAPVGSYFAGWLGREAFHAGGFVAHGGAWAILGAKEYGKSTTLAWLAREGEPVLADDILVVADGRTALAGPRCIDLREGAAASLDLASSAAPARAGERLRIALPPTAPEVPLRGWIFLEWGPRVELARLGPGDRITRLARYRNRRAAGNDAALLDLASLPAWELRRPRRIDLLDDAARRLLDLAAG
jgi:hypothetical protein